MLSKKTRVELKPSFKFVHANILVSIPKTDIIAIMSYVMRRWDNHQRFNFDL